MRVSCDAPKIVACEKFQASDRWLFNVQNDWILFSRDRAAVGETSAMSVALKVFNTHFNDAYVLPDSSVFLVQETGDNVWEVWNGFKASKSDTIRVFKIGTASPNFLNISGLLYEEKRNFRGITLKANSVVRIYAILRTIMCGRKKELTRLFSTQIVNKENFFGFDKKISSDLDIFSHMHYEITVTLSRQLNFK